MKRYSIAAAACAVLTLLAAQPATAATEFGDNCAANEATETSPNTFFSITAAGDALPLTAPSNGVITKWKFSSSIPTSFTFKQTLKVLRLTGPTVVQIVGEATGSISPGSNVFDTRIPVQAGDRLGEYGSAEEISGSPVGNVYCLIPGPENQIGAFLGGGGGPGSTNPFVTIEAPARFPVAAVIEPDADNDGYGDETQDGCPQSAATHEACPTIVLNATSSVKKGSVTVSVTASSPATVTVRGTAKLGKGKTAKLKAPKKSVSPGKLTRFTLRFPGKLKSALAGLKKGKSLPLKITATAPNLVGAPSKKVLKVKLKG